MINTKQVTNWEVMRKASHDKLVANREQAAKLAKRIITLKVMQVRNFSWSKETEMRELTSQLARTGVTFNV